MFQCFVAIVTHKMQKGVKTKFFEELETTGKNFILPNNAEEFQEMMELVLYNSSAYTFHRRMREALLGMQLPLYSQFKKSKCTETLLVNSQTLLLNPSRS